MNYKTIIGLEVHVELKTKSKMFCQCLADYFGQKPNTRTCPVCLGLPGALPVPNKKAIQWCVLIGMALNCRVPLVSKFDRKNYFYPDLAKGYQISQYDEPFCLDGKVEIRKKDGSKKTIRIRRVHMEEDTGKLIHETINGEKASLIDFNRSGVPLVEIVTEPDIETAEEAVAYLQKLKQIVRYLDVSNADMEKGAMRLEPNISLKILHGEKADNKLPSYKVEVKNINSFRFVEKAIEFEIKRQKELLEKGETPKQETRGWDENRQKTVSQRLKEEAHDYRYFPEPDIPEIHWTEAEISSLKASVPELSDTKIERFMQNYQLSYYNCEILTREKSVADFFEEVVLVGKEFSMTPTQIANEMINKKIDITQLTPAQFVKQIVEQKEKVTIDESVLDQKILQVLDLNPHAVMDFQKGKENVVKFLIGQVMHSLGQKIDPIIVKERLIVALKK